MALRQHLRILGSAAFRSRKFRKLAGAGLVLHGLAHAVFPLRGAGSFANSAWARWIIEWAWIVAMVGFAVAGVGLMGARPLAKFWRRSTAFAVAASLVTFGGFRQIDLVPGALIDAFVLIAFYRPPEVGVAPPVSASPSRWAPIMRGAGDIAAISLVAYLAFFATTRSWHHRWGATDAELDAALPGDSPDRSPAFEVNHAITIDAAPSSVWPWLVQIGQDRAGFYNYDWLENLFGLHIQNAERVHREWQVREEGDLVRAAPADWLGGAFGKDVGWRVTHVEVNRAMVLRSWGAFVLDPLPGARTRLLVRSKVSDRKVPVWAAALSFATFEPPHFIMEQRMLTGIKMRVERTGREAPAPIPETTVVAQPGGVRVTH